MNMLVSFETCGKCGQLDNDGGVTQGSFYCHECLDPSKSDELEDDILSEDKKNLNREEKYEKLAKLQSKIKKNPRKLASEDGVFILDPKNKYDREWYEDDDPTDEGINKNES